MTDMTTETEVTQADEQRAEEWSSILNHRWSEYEGDPVADLAKDFALHRIASLNAFRKDNGDKDRENSVEAPTRLQFMQARIAELEAQVASLTTDDALDYEELSVRHGQNVEIIFRNEEDAFALFNELKARGKVGRMNKCRSDDALVERTYDAGSQKMDPVTVEAMVDVIASAKARWTMGDKTGPDFDALKAQHAAMASVQYQAEAIVRSLGNQS